MALNNQHQQLICQTESDDSARSNLTDNGSFNMSTVISRKQRSLQRLKTTQSAETSLNCPHCEKTFKRKLDKEKHLSGNCDERPHRCEHCQRCFKQLAHLQIHSKTHSSEKSFACPQCFKTFKRKLELKIHTAVHSDDRPFKCEHCHESFKLLTILRVHARIHSGKLQSDANNVPKPFPKKEISTNIFDFTTSMKRDHISAGIAKKVSKERST